VALGACLRLRRRGGPALGTVGHRVVQAGLLGVMLGIAVVFVSGACLILANRATGGDGTAGLAAATTAGNAAAVPMLVAAADPKYAAAAGPATVLVAASVIVTSLLVPPITAWWATRMRAATVTFAEPVQELDR